MNLLDILFPKNCLDCNASGKYICSPCLAKVERARSICPVCKKYSYSGKTHNFCKQKYALDGMYSFYKYEGVVRKAILRLKYNFASSIATELVDSCLKNSNIPSYLLHTTCYLIPVPLHPQRERWRGFNQAAVLGELLAKKYKWDYSEKLLIRLENTAPQVKLGREERLRNIYGKFAVNGASFIPKDRKIIIFDDVWTTGATITEICKVLKKAGAKEVWGMSVARS